ncbi:MAG: sugar transferase [Candidatus Azobacteroides sp.]|nr:sugar transferase [Candidatus Azobacteroides sp.]
MGKKSQLFKYLIADYIAANLAWFAFNIVRYYEIARYDGFDTLSGFLLYRNVIFGQIIVSFGWLILHYYSGYYNKLFEKSRLSEFFTTLGTVLIGTIVLFFALLLKILPDSILVYYTQLAYLFFFTFGFTYLFRVIITNRTARKIRNREWTTNALILGTGEKALQIQKLLNEPSASIAYTIQGFIRVNPLFSPPAIDEQLILGGLDDLETLIRDLNTEELIVVGDSEDEDDLLNLLYSLYQYQLPLKLPVSHTRLLTGNINIKAITGFPLFDVTNHHFSEGEKNIKLTLDKLISLFLLVFLSPIYLYLLLRIKKDSEGPVLIKQERIGYLGKPFMMYKFRTMREDAEKDGPALSSEKDERVTPFGLVMRKYRLDELPQFWNVLKGDMSIVGPRPERKYYIDRIVKQAPYFYLLHNVRPGITSWGMVKFGYARNIDEMIERMKYDILYYENMSLMLDLKIIIYTFRTILTGKGI